MLGAPHPAFFASEEPELATEREPVANFVPRASGSRDALIEDEYIRNEPTKFRLAMDFTLELAEPTASFSFAARQSDVGMVRTSLRDESAKTGSLSDAPLQPIEFRSEVDTRKENPGAIEEAQPLQLSGNSRRTQLAKPADYAFVLLGVA